MAVYEITDFEKQSQLITELGLLDDVVAIGYIHGGRYVFGASFTSEEDFDEYKKRHGKSLPAWVHGAHTRTQLTKAGSVIKTLVADLHAQGQLERFISESKRLKAAN